MTGTPLIEVAQQMGLRTEASIWGRWIRFPAERGTVYVVQASFGKGYFVWCEAPGLRTARLFRDPRDAIEAGLRCGTGATSALAHVTAPLDHRGTPALQNHHNVGAPLRSARLPEASAVTT